MSARAAKVFLAGDAPPASGESEPLEGTVEAGGLTAFERTLPKDEFPVGPLPGAEPGATGEPGVEFAERPFGSGGRS
jgi:hypothetical protein